MPISRKKIAGEFRSLLDEILNSKELIDKAVYGRSSIKLKAQAPTKLYTHVIHLTDADQLGVFNKNGSLNKERCQFIGVQIDETRISASAEMYGFAHLSLREQLILDAAIFEAKGKLQLLPHNMQYLTDAYSDESEQLAQEFKSAIQEVPIEVVKQLAPLKLTSPDSYSVPPEVRAKLKDGFFNFSATNIHISPGPRANDEDRGIVRFLDNLSANKIKHVFAIGRIHSYHLQDRVAEGRPIAQDIVMDNDFTNYFIPDASGKVVLPPELKDYSIESKPVEKAGRITTYAVSINGGRPIYVHHYPLRDKQPLELTEDELNYVRTIQARTTTEENILTHCRGGKGQSAQIAYILASNHEKYTKIKDSTQRLQFMRKERTGHENSRSFIETAFQEKYIGSLDELFSSPPVYTKDTAILDTYQLMTLVFEDEFQRLDALYGNLEDKVAEHRGITATDNLSPEHKHYLQLLEFYHSLPEKKTTSQLINVLEQAQKLPIVSEPFKTILAKKDADLCLDYLFQKIKEDAHQKPAPVNHKALFEVAARRFDFNDLSLKLLNNKEQWAEGLERSQYWPKFKLIKVHIAQAYLRQYQSFIKNKQWDKKIDCEISVASHLKSSIEDLFKDFAQAKKINDAAKWQESSQLCEALKELAALYVAQIKPDRELEQSIAKLARVVELGMSAEFTFSDEKIELPQGVFIKETIPSISQIQENAEKLEILYEAVQWLIDQYPEEKDTGTFIQEAHDALLINFDNEVKEKAFIDENLDIFSDYLTAVAKTDPSLSQNEARQHIRKLWEKAWLKIVERYDEKEPFAQKFDEEAKSIEAAKNTAEGIDKKMQVKHGKKDKAVAAAHALIASAQREIDEEMRFRLKEVAEEKPKVWVFDVDDTLVDLEKGNIKKRAELFKLLSYAKQNDIDIAICTNRTPSVDQDPLSNGGYPVERLLKDIEDKTGIVVHPDRVVTYTPSIQKEQLELKESDFIFKEVADQALPEKPKVWVFDVDDTLVDLEKGNIKKRAELFKLLSYAKQNGIDIAICTNRTPSVDQDPLSNGGYPVERLLKDIEDETGIVVHPDLVVTYTPSIQSEVTKILRQEKRSNQRHHLYDENFTEAAITRLLGGKNYQLDTIRLRYAELKQGHLKEEEQRLMKEQLTGKVAGGEALSPERRAVNAKRLIEIREQLELKESDFVFVDDNLSIFEQTIKLTNYRCVKAPDHGGENPEYLVQLAYESGAFNPLIRFLQSDTQTLAPNTRAIPNFDTLGFKYSPVIQHVSLEQFYKRVEKLTEDKIKQEEYKYDFTRQAVSAYAALNEDLRVNIETEAYHYLAKNMADIRQQLVQMKTSGHAEGWQALSAKIEQLIQLETLYAANIGRTYLSIDLALLKAIVQSEPANITLGDDSKAVLLPKEKEGTVIASRIDSIATTDAKPHPASIQTLEGFQVQKEQYVQQINQVLGVKTNESIQNYLSIDESADIYDEDPSSYQVLVSNIETFVEGEELEKMKDSLKGNDIADGHAKLMKLERLIQKASQLAPAIELRDAVTGEASGNYQQRLAAAASQAKNSREALESNAQDQAKLFLDKAERYLKSPERKWEVGLQLTPFTIEGTKVKIPRHVALQLEQIKKAKNDGDYVKHKAEFLRIGEQKQASFWSSKGSNTYFGFFKGAAKDETVEQKVEKEFDTPTFKKSPRGS